MHLLLRSKLMEQQASCLSMQQNFDRGVTFDRKVTGVLEMVPYIYCYNLTNVNIEGGRKSATVQFM